MPQLNEYAACFGDGYSKIPKEVFAAVAFSMCLLDVNDHDEKVMKRFMHEWKMLNENGIVKQRPPTVFGTLVLD